MMSKNSMPKGIAIDIIAISSTRAGIKYIFPKLYIKNFMKIKNDTYFFLNFYKGNFYITKNIFICE
jgi:hypothetical protein